MAQESVNQDDKQVSVGNNEKNKPSTQDENGNLIPQARFNEYVAKSNSKQESMQKEIDKYKAKEQKHRQANLEAQGDYKQIIFEQDAELKNLREFKTTIDKQNAEKRQTYLDMLTDDEFEAWRDSIESRNASPIMQYNNLEKERLTDTKNSLKQLMDTVDQQDI